MARKRMISPEIWESQSFGKLSVLSKLVFIGLFSLADDEGKGILLPQLIKSKLLPYDEKTRITDIQQSIKEICAEMSIISYEVGGKQYYKLTRWSEWQYIKKPTLSKIPDPPCSGEGEELHSEAQVRYEYGNSTVPVPHSYPPEKEKEKEKEDEDNARARASSSIPKFVNVDCEIPNDTDLGALMKKVEASEYLRSWKFLSKYIAKKEKILGGYYDSFSKLDTAPKDTCGYERHQYTEEQLRGAFVNFEVEE